MSAKPFSSAPCDAFADLLVDYSDNELNAEGRQLVTTHLAGCTSCRHHLARLNASRDVLAAAIDQRQASTVRQRASTVRQRASTVRQQVSTVRQQASGGRQPAEINRRQTHIRPFLRTTVLTLAATAAAILLVVSIAPRLSRGPLNSHAPHHHKPAAQSREPEEAPSPSILQKPSPQKLTAEEALWQIAVLEEQARLEASLDLLPSHGPFAAQRAADQRLLAQYQSLVPLKNVK
jgi:hypothetical protein